MMEALAQSPLSGLWPQIALAAAVCVVLCSGIFLPRGNRAWKLLLPATLIAAFALVFGVSAVSQQGPLLRFDGLTIGWQLLFYGGALPLALLLRSEDEVGAALLLASVLGMGLLAAAGSLLMLFIGLEFMSLPAYLLVARGRRRKDCHEAAMKYFFAGGAAGSLFLLGLALYYAAGKTLALAAAPGPMAAAGLALMGAAALFKVGAFPFHFWLPDVYESSDPELTGFLSTSMKAAAVLLLMRVAALSPDSLLARALPWAGAVTALYGAVMALRQTRLQRLLAYSSMSHAGNLVLGVGAWALMGCEPAAAAALYYYLAAYVLISNGAFLFLRVSGLRERGELRGFAAVDAGSALLFAVLLLSLGGIPPTAGFLAKLLIFWEAIKAAAYGPALAAGMAALVGLGYYLGLVRDMYFESPSASPSTAAAGQAPTFDKIVLAACAAPAAVLGLAPWLVGIFERMLAP